VRHRARKLSAKLKGALRWGIETEDEGERLRHTLLAMPRGTPGAVRAFGWDLEYVDAHALWSCLDVLVLKRWNDFTPDNDEPMILDCGANIGISVLNYKRWFPKAHIIAFEPDPFIFPILRRNLVRNGCDDVVVVQAAVASKQGEATFFCEGADGSRLVSEDQRTNDNTVLVRTVALGDYLSDTVDLLKVDIEGAEFEVLAHLTGRSQNVRNMVVECHLTNRNVAPFANLLQSLAGAGFSVAVNPYGAWRDLVHRPQKGVHEFDQYLLVAAWRDE
jgi:FkbM family methyltransferase